MRGSQGPNDLDHLLVGVTKHGALGGGSRVSSAKFSNQYLYDMACITKLCRSYHLELETPHSKLETGSFLFSTMTDLTGSICAAL